MTPRPVAVVFDVDGTLVDSERHGHRVAFNEAFAHAGLPYRWDEDLYGDLLAIPGGQRRLHHYLTDQGHTPASEIDALSARLHADKTERFRALAADGQIPARPGVERLLDELAAADITLAVATTGQRTWVEPLLERLFGLDRFAVVVGGDDVSRLKPDPEGYEEALRRLGASPEQVIAVEDSEKGVTAAVAAGLTCVDVLNDYTRHEVPEGAALVVDGFGKPGRAQVLRGPPDILEEGAVTVATVCRLHAARAGHR